MPEESIAEFTERARRWLSDRLPPAAERVGTRSMALVDEVDPALEAELVAAARAWQAQLYDEGFADLTGQRRRAFLDVAAEFDTPDMRPLLVGLHIVAPALRGHGSAELQQKYLAPILRGDRVACQLFSEPDAGSDLASVRTGATPVDGGWRVTGQKIWTSSAHLADVAELLVRTDPDMPRHRGLSLMMVELDQPGIEVRPLRQMTGGASFNEVFLTDAFVPAENLIGALDQGWSVAMTSLSSERAALGGEFDSVPPHTLDRLMQMAAECDRSEDPLVQVAVADLAINLFATEALRERADNGDLASELVGSVTKLMVNRTLEYATVAATEIGGERVLSMTGQTPDSDWSEFILGKPSFRLAGGTDEIQRNLIAERHLGLPRERR